MSAVRFLTPLLFLPMALYAVDSAAPTRSDWLPVAQALRSGSGETVAKAEALIQRFPDWPGSYMGLAAHELARGDAGDSARYADAIGYAKQALERSTETTYPVAIVLAALTRMGKAKEALTVFNRYQDSDTTGILSLLASQAALADGQLSKAAVLVDNGLALAGPNQASADFYCQQGVILLRTGKAKDALEPLRTASERDPQSGSAWYNLGLAYQAQGMHDQAFAALTKAAALYADDPDVKLAAATAAMEAGDLNAARTNLDVASDLAPGRADIAIAKAACLTALAASADDRDAFEAAATLIDKQRPDDSLRAAVANTAVAAALGSRRPEHYALAIEALNTAGPDVMLPVNRGLARWLAGIQAAEQQPDRAIELFQQAIADLTQAATQAPADANLQRYLGHVHAGFADVLTASNQPDMATSELDAAATAYEAAIAAGDFPARHFHLALQSGRNGELAYAAAAAAIARDPLNTGAWKVAIGSYGSAGAWKQPIHLVVWGVLLLVLLIVGLKKPAVPRQRAERPARRPTGAAANAKRSPAAEKARRLQEQQKVDETFLPKSMAPRTAPLQKGKSKQHTPRPQEPQKADETFLPQTMAPKGKKDAALDRQGRRK